MKKLEVGDYVKNLTEKQFNKLLDVECGLGILTWGIPNSHYYYHNGLLFADYKNLLHAKKEKCIKELTYRQFLTRAKNTFKI